MHNRVQAEGPLLTLTVVLDYYNDRRMEMKRVLGLTILIFLIELNFAQMAYRGQKARPIRTPVAPSPRIATPTEPPISEWNEVRYADGSTAIYHRDPNQIIIGSYGAGGSDLPIGYKA